MATIALKPAVAASTVSAKAVPKAPAFSIDNLPVKGRGKADREMAFMKIAPLSFVENVSRVETIANLRTALGNASDADTIKIAQIEWTIGRVAARLPADQFPIASNGAAPTSSDKLERARLLITSYAAPTPKGKKVKALRAGQIGRRTETEHKVIRAADEAWSLVKAELGAGTAQTMKERNEKKSSRAAHHNVSGKGAKGSTQVAQSDTLGKASAPMNAHEARAHIELQAATLLAFANKHAALLPTDYGMAVKALKRAVDDASKAFGLARDKADADKAARSK